LKSVKIQQASKKKNFCSEEYQLNILTSGGIRGISTGQVDAIKYLSGWAIESKSHAVVAHVELVAVAIMGQ